MGSAVCGDKNRNMVVGPVSREARQQEVADQHELIFNDQSSLTEDDCEIVELSVKCTNLYTENRFQLLNPMACILVKVNDEFVKKAETETIFSTINPIFRKSIRAVFSLKQDFALKIEIWDNDIKKNSKVLLGSNFFSFHEIASRTDYICKDLILANRKTGFIYLGAKEMKHLNSVIRMQWNFAVLQPTKSFCALKISRALTTGFLQVYQSETRPGPFSKP
jgi:hypothetical protein